MIACALWVIGVEGLASLHQGMHGRLTEHDHTDGGIVTTGHRHTPDGRHARRPTAPRSEAAMSEPASGHDTGSLAHRGVAIQAPPPPVTQPIPVDRLLSFAVAQATAPILHTDAITPIARGPPGSA